MTRKPKQQIILRVQDADGRGPWRPGFSHHWADESKLIPPPFYEEFPSLDLQAEKRNGFLGCGCRDEKQLTLWFNAVELERLREFGYSIVKMEVDRVIAESVNQLIFCRKKPLAIDVILHD